MKKILVLGATGSIGTSTLDIARNMPSDFKIGGITAHSDNVKLEKLKTEFKCAAALTSIDGTDGIKRLIDDCKPDIVVNGIAGSAGLEPSRIVLESGIDLALANKETVVMAWPLIKALSKKTKAKIIPVDSEHSAVFCLINQCGKKNISEIIITASGGPFRTYSPEQLKKVTLEDALKHPTWNMGKKITIDSATLANKGLEVIEATRLFDMSADKVKVVVHPQSFVHSLVRTNDGMLYAQISDPDMKHPIYQSLVYPENKNNYLKPFDLFDKELNFYRPRTEDFPMLKYAYEAASKNGGYTIAFNAANEVAVAAFIKGKIGFTDIPKITCKTLEKDFSFEPQNFEDVFKIDTAARAFAEELL
ncbi:1-deoxy-D-xylulose-5-phosphate reductoisomerase [Treponema sp.]|uniref:1-deoxy-D-xylulose-5-phosphate reductoisomerase n=1 Tax=Treponema sp. TaxID=166 RepID=UPI00298DD468|nr:1-deoxy-D-xylulose-5-phosphate reductoisomerase [Treponema sp.]MCR5613208.1 1-deoxy-D-xylulose-5-phosphate reductoisomerase [Treponema sp.]